MEVGEEGDYIPIATLHCNTRITPALRWAAGEKEKAPRLLGERAPDQAKGERENSNSKTLFSEDCRERERTRTRKRYFQGLERERERTRKLFFQRIVERERTRTEKLYFPRIVEREFELENFIFQGLERERQTDRQNSKTLFSKDCREREMCKKEV